MGSWVPLFLYSYANRVGLNSWKSVVFLAVILLWPVLLIFAFGLQLGSRTWIWLLAARYLIHFWVSAEFKPPSHRFLAELCWLMPQVLLTSSFSCWSSFRSSSLSFPEQLQDFRFTAAQFSCMNVWGRLCAVIGVLQGDCVKFIAGWIPGVLLSHRIDSLEDLCSKLFSRSSFSDTSTKCSVKCLRGDKLFLSRVLVVDLLCDLISSSPCLHYSS
jgi:hypothetical protein